MRPSEAIRPVRDVHVIGARTCERTWGGCLVAVLAVCLLLIGSRTDAQKSQPAASAASTSPTYSRDIRSILEARCVVCHNAGVAANLPVSGGLSLDTYSAIRQGIPGRKTAPVLVAGKSGESGLYARITAASASRLMPKGGPALPRAQIALIKQWIDAGAPAGAAAVITTPHESSPESLPMPVDRMALDVSIPTKAELPPGILDKDGKPDISLKVGPLPPVTALTYSPDGKRLAVGVYRAVAIWDTVTGQPVTVLTHLPGAVQALSYRPDGTMLAVGGGVPGVSGDVRLFDTKTWSQTGRTLIGASDTVLSVAWSADGGRLAAGSQDKSARVWEISSGKEVRVVKDHSDAVTRVCLSPDGKALYTASLDHNARRFDVDKGGLVRLFTGHNEAITALALSPDGKRLVTSGGEPNLRWWNVESGETTNNIGGHGAAVSEVAFAKDGSLVVSASADKTVRLWDGKSTDSRRAFEGSSDWLYTAAVSPDNRFVAGAGAEGLIRIWEAANGRLRLSLLFWPPARDGSACEWAAITPEGYCDGSPGWVGHMTFPTIAKGIAPARLQGVIHLLAQATMVQKAWQGGPVEPAKPAAK